VTELYSVGDLVSYRLKPGYKWQSAQIIGKSDDSLVLRLTKTGERHQIGRKKQKDLIRKAAIAAVVP